MHHANAVYVITLLMIFDSIFLFVHPSIIHCDSLSLLVLVELIRHIGLWKPGPSPFIVSMRPNSCLRRRGKMHCDGGERRKRTGSFNLLSYTASDWFELNKDVGVSP